MHLAKTLFQSSVPRPLFIFHAPRLHCFSFDVHFALVLDIPAFDQPDGVQGRVSLWSRKWLQLKTFILSRRSWFLVTTAAEVSVLSVFLLTVLSAICFFRPENEV